MTILFQSCQYVFVTTQGTIKITRFRPFWRGPHEVILRISSLQWFWFCPQTQTKWLIKKKKKLLTGKLLPVCWSHRKHIHNHRDAAGRLGERHLLTTGFRVAPSRRRRHTSATRSPGQRPPRPRWPALCSRRSRSLTRPGNASFPFLPSRFYPLAKPPFKQPLKWNCHYSRPFIFLTLIAFIFHYVNYNI